MAAIRKPKNALKFSRPASWWGSTWREALPTGNGVIGAAVYGGAAEDVVMINHSDLWWQGHVGVLQDVADKLKDVRKKMDDGAVKEAENILSNGLITKGYRPQLSYPLPLCDFKIKMNVDRAPRDYVRVLNMESGEVSVSFRDGASRFERSMFVSRAQDIIAYEITRTGSKPIDVKFSLDLHERFNARTPTAISKLPDGVNTKYENYFMYFSARSDNGTEFGVVGFINHYGGSQQVSADGIRISGASSVLVLLKPFVESQREKEWKGLKTKLSSIKSTYEKLLKEHTPQHSKLFNSAEFDLDAADRDEFADVLLDKAFQTGELPDALIEKLWAFGRYLTVCGSSPNSLPLAPYGLWCGDYKAENAQIRADGSLQNTYAHVLTGNLADYLKSVFTYYESVLDDLRKNASRIYGCRGLLVPSIMAHGTGVFGRVDSGVLHFTAAGGWIAKLFYDYYLYTDDVKFLKEHALPFMKEVAMFYEEFFKVSADGCYDSCPSYSPGTTPLNYASGGVDTLEIARNATVDFAVAKELLTNLIEGSQIAGVNTSDTVKWKDMLTRIPDYKLNEDGTVKEYCDSRFTDNPSAVSTAMYYPVYPAAEIDESSEQFKAFGMTAKRKAATSVGAQSAQSLIAYANVFTHLGEGAVAMEILTNIVRCMAMNNLIIASSDWRGMGIAATDIWAGYSIEGNTGLTGVVQDMIVQSKSDSIRLLPSLPDSLPKGDMTGLQTRTGAELSVNWDIKRGVVIAKIKSRKAKTVNVVLPKGAKKMKSVGEKSIDYATGLVTGLPLPAGKVVTLDIRL